MDWIWNMARGPYQAFLGLGNDGVPVTVNNLITVEIPAEATSWLPWENYEAEAVTLFVQWIRNNPEALVVDIGCSTGIYSLLTLSASPDSSVIAIDSDVPSLYLTQQLVKHTANRNLHLVHCFVGARSSVTETLEVAEARARKAVEAIQPNTPARYRCLTDGEDGIPVSSLDNLLKDTASETPVLIKCDVEGAEKLVLDGAGETLKGRRPTLLLSVHPPALPDYKTSPKEISDLLASAGYRFRLISEDHEEHWWCEPVTVAPV
ncbi:MAG TPA: FkbM family methyltransferase [Gemmatimonadaceae bacterium]|nr:FkbM family methyltransferase [Gemmatimonadaceae bacterium]